MTQIRTIVAGTGWLIAVILLVGCAATEVEPVVATNAAGADMLAAVEARQPQAYRFYPGDEISVIAVNRPELTLTTKVDPHGNIAYPYLGQVNVQDLSPAEVAERLTRALQEGEYYVRPMLSVSLVSAKEQFIYVLGEVKKPGQIAITGSLPLLEAIGRAGGQTYESEMSTVLWIRGKQSPPGMVKLNLSDLGDPRKRDAQIPRLAMIPGDVLYVPDSVIASVERFMKRISGIIAPIIDLERGLILWPEVEAFLNNSSTSQPLIVK